MRRATGGRSFDPIPTEYAAAVQTDSPRHSGDVGVALVIQHLEPEHSGAIGLSLAASGRAVDVRRTDLGDDVPSEADDFAAVVIMGGPMSAFSDTGFPSRLAEIALAESAIRRRIPFLGVCLGAQILAQAAGGRCFAGSGPELGWAPITWTPARDTDPLLAELESGPLDVFHWHGDTFDLPPGAELLASSDLYVNQVFRVGPAAWGMQCHLEVDADLVGAMVREFAAEATPEQRAQIAARTPAAVARLRPVQERIFARFARLANTDPERGGER